MSDFGEELRRERESRGITLDSIVNATKISSRHLLALEAGHFDHLPGGVFNKGIVRSYAQMVGLNPEAWVRRYMSAYQTSGKVTDDDASWIAFAENVRKGRAQETDIPKIRISVARVAVLLCVLAALGWLVWAS